MIAWPSSRERLTAGMVLAPGGIGNIFSLFASGMVTRVDQRLMLAFGCLLNAVSLYMMTFLTLGMVVAPCSTRSLAAISMGYANTLIHRAADVTMKEGRPLDLIVAGVRRPGGQDDRHERRLSSVPGVRVVRSEPGTPPSALDALLEGTLVRFGIAASST